MQEGFGRLITSGKIMRKLPQDLAFPLGLGSKRSQNHFNGDVVQNNNANNRVNNVLPVPNAAATAAIGTNGRRSPSQDLDTINL